MNKNFEETMKEIEKINKSLDKMKKFLPKATDDEKEQIYIFMDYLEREYKKLQIDLIIEERDRKI